MGADSAAHYSAASSVPDMTRYPKTLYPGVSQISDIESSVTGAAASSLSHQGDTTRCNKCFFESF
jgi:hypothetical protein